MAAAPLLSMTYLGTDPTTDLSPQLRKLLHSALTGQDAVSAAAGAARFETPTQAPAVWQDLTLSASPAAEHKAPAAPTLARSGPPQRVAAPVTVASLRTSASDIKCLELAKERLALWAASGCRERLLYSRCRLGHNEHTIRPCRAGDRLTLASVPTLALITLAPVLGSKFYADIMAVEHNAAAVAARGGKMPLTCNYSSKATGFAQQSGDQLFHDRELNLHQLHVPHKHGLVLYVGMNGFSLSAMRQYGRLPFLVGSVMDMSELSLVLTDVPDGQEVAMLVLRVACGLVADTWTVDVIGERYDAVGSPSSVFTREMCRLATDFEIHAARRDAGGL